ncbi:hypothetical protein G2W53_003067 [Senna tora]|uniref:Uncharacterized protein n=1 Tax=Senna tora TaxID=362788 RepID=A0A834XB05_9FABA|nr:hypothetical protein G2W53_003067 [Senna tora]
MESHSYKVYPKPTYNTITFMVAFMPLKVLVKLERRDYASIAIAGMKHSGPSPGGKGHRPRFLAQPQDSGPSPGVGH